MAAHDHACPPEPSMGLRIAVLADNAALPGFQAEHGLSLALVLPDGGLWLWDTGQSGLFLAHARRLGLDPAQARGVALSHGHYDHTGGLEHLLRLPGFHGEVVAHPAFAIPRYRRAASRVACAIGCPCPPALLSQRRLRVVHSDARLDEQGLFMLGAIPRLPGNPQSVQGMFLDPQGEWSDIIPDDACLVFKRRGALAVILGCCHSGLANTLEAVRQNFGNGEIRLLAGGLHLAGHNGAAVREAIRILREHAVKKVFPGHCTGTGAIREMREAMPDRVTPLAAGMIIDTF